MRPRTEHRCDASTPQGAHRDELAAAEGFLGSPLPPDSTLHTARHSLHKCRGYDARPSFSSLPLFPPKPYPSSSQHPLFFCLRPLSLQPLCHPTYPQKTRINIGLYNFPHTLQLPNFGAVIDILGHRGPGGVGGSGLEGSDNLGHRVTDFGGVLRMGCRWERGRLWLVALGAGGVGVWLRGACGVW